jgi:hypothetical protein
MVNSVLGNPAPKSPRPLSILSPFPPYPTLPYPLPPHPGKVVLPFPVNLELA